MNRWAILTVLLLIGMLNAFTAHVHAPAVLLNENKGTLTNIYLNVSKGRGIVNVSGPAQVGNSTLYSAETAAAYASSYLGINESDYNFTYYIKDSGVNVSGPSAGLAFTMLAVSALMQRQMFNNFTVTGTIDSTGSAGEVGGVYDKIGAAAKEGMEYALVPYTQESIERLVYYIAQQTYGVPLIEVGNLSEAMKYAYGTSPRPMVLNTTSDYNLGRISNASLACISCNQSYFSELTNYTFNVTRTEIAGMGSSYADAKAGMLAQLSNYTAIASKGYLYTGADLAFVEYQQAFTLANSGNLSRGSAASLLDGISAYCSSLSPPQMTTANYEYVIGGELRQEWGIINMRGAYALLNATQTSDDVISAIDYAAPSEAWCGASAEMYDIAAGMQGSTVNLSSGVKSDAYRAINNARQYGSSMYLTAAISAYNASEYATALYSATYASVFGSSTQPMNYSDAKAVEEIRTNIENSTYGIWPAQFADEAGFYLQQAAITSENGTNASISSAYEIALLSRGLAGANKEIRDGFVAGTGTQKLPSINPGGPVIPSVQPETISALEAENNLIMAMFAVLFAMLLVIIILLVIISRDIKASGRKRGGRR